MGIQEIAWLVNNNVDFEAANTRSSGERTVYIELAVKGKASLQSSMVKLVHVMSSGTIQHGCFRMGCCKRVR